MSSTGNHIVFFSNTNYEHETHVRRFPTRRVERRHVVRGFRRFTGTTRAAVVTPKTVLRPADRFDVRYSPSRIRVRKNTKNIVERDVHDEKRTVSRMHASGSGVVLRAIIRGCV